MFGAVLDESILKRAQKKGLLKINVHNIRDYSLDKHKKVDDKPFGGGPGMIMRTEPIFRAIRDIKSKVNPSTTLRVDDERSRTIKSKKFPNVVTQSSYASGSRRRTEEVASFGTKIILLSPKGKALSHALAKKLSKNKHLILICGHYEGIDERVKERLVDAEISIGDYVLTGGELPAMVLIDAIARLIPGVLGREDSLTDETFQGNLLEYPQYTRPAVFKGMKVPTVLLSGNHKKIQEWRKKEALRRTKKLRPDLLK